MSMAEKDYRDWCKQKSMIRKGKDHARIQYSSDKKPYVAKVKDNRHKRIKFFDDEE